MMLSNTYYFKLFYVLLLLPLSQIVAGGSSKGGEVKCIERERLALLRFKQSVIDDSGMLSTWRGDQDCCKWKGIECSNETGHVLTLHLRGSDTRHLTGPINISSLIDLESIEYLDLSYHDFLGNNIPELLGSFTNLRYLNLSCSSFGGRIPTQLGNISRLQYLDISDNYSLEGGIPSQLGNLKHLRYLDLQENRLNGSVPSQIGNLRMLHTLGLGQDYGDINLETKDVEWLSNLSSLTNLRLKSLRGNSHPLLQIIGELLPNLRELRLSNFGLLDNDIRSLFDSHNSNISTSLTILDLSQNMLTSSIFQLLSNFSSNLQELYLSSNNIVLSPSIYPYFPSLVTIDLSNNNMTSLIFQSHFNFSSKLQKLYMSNCSLMDTCFPVSSSASSIMNASSSLTILDLSYNMLKSSAVFHWLFNFTTNLHSLDLWDNLLECSIPDDFDKVMNSLEYLDLGHNNLQGKIPASLWYICTLHTLDLSRNNLSGEIPSFNQNSSCRNTYTVHSLDISYDRITGRLPESIGLLSELESLYLQRNSLEGDVTESHLTHLHKLRNLHLSYNSLSLKFASTWVPPFQLVLLKIATCKLGTKFPSWLLSQSKLAFLDISDAGINDFVPERFWNHLQMIQVLNMSHNNLRGAIPNFPFHLTQNPRIYMNSNQFEGALPSFFSQALRLSLSKNNFSDLSSFLCSKSANANSLRFLDLSNNQLMGQLPNCWESLNSLLSLDLSNNNFFGEIPLSIGTLVKLKALNLQSNSFTGELPSTLKNCTNLIMLGVGENMLSGPIPPWIGESLQHLIILIMRGNYFSENLPMPLCSLRNIQLLDLSRNNLSKGIPTCIKNFTAMAAKGISIRETLLDTYYNIHDDFEIIYDSIWDYKIPITFMWKGVEDEFKDPAFQLKSIDLSSNNLSGDVPKEFGDVLGLVSLNLSRNNLSGEIPYGIGNLISLQFLDLSRNHLSGKIPSTLSQIDGMGMLDLSNNNLSGEIPFERHLETFDASSFEGNPDLCGKQLNKTCPEDDTPRKPQVPAVAPDQDENSDFYNALYKSLELGFLTGFWAFLGPILLWRAWRNTYARFLNKMMERIHEWWEYICLSATPHARR